MTSGVHKGLGLVKYLCCPYLFLFALIMVLNYIFSICRIKHRVIRPVINSNVSKSIKTI